MAYTYQYSMSTSFPTGLNLTCLQYAIDIDEDITTSLLYCQGEGDVLSLIFDSQLSAPQESILNNIIDTHDPMDSCPPQQEIITADRIYATYIDGTTITGTSIYMGVSGTINIVGMEHATLSGLSGDDHTQYHTNSRGDARYYTQTQLTNGQLDTRYYTETETNIISGALDTKLTTHKSSSDHDSRYYTESETNVISGALDSKLTTHKGSADHDGRYYTETELNNGQLDTRYYTETETNTISGALNTKLDNHKSSSDHDSRYYTETEVDTISGALNTKINTKVNTSDFTELAQDVVGTSLSGINITITYNDTTGFTTLSGGSGGGVTAHSALTGLSADDHTQYTLANGTRAFTSTVSGVTPTLSPHLTTKGYVDTLISGSDIACVTAQTNAAFFLSTSWQDVPFQNAQYQNRTDILQRDPSNTDRILIKETGTYLISCNLPVYCPAVERVDVRVRKNDNTVISGSETYLNDSATQQVTNTFAATLSGGEFITVQALGQNTSEYIGIGSTFTVMRAKGPKGADGVNGATGAKGDPGSGSNIVVKDNGVTISGSPTATINFIGHTIDASVSGTATVNNLFGSYYSSASNDTEDSTTNTAFKQWVRLTTSGLAIGTYRVGWYAELRENDITYDVRMQIQQNDAVVLSTINIEPKDVSNYFPASGFVYVTLTSGTTYNFDLDYSSENAGATAYIRRARLEFWRVS